MLSRYKINGGSLKLCQIKRKISECDRLRLRSSDPPPERL
ncbi:hypothetical protein NIES2104_53050 [Leptolyngbya sp. NIES-2104]|nr:hypothetical protein NIES2104_53050 [Leptolyngbya sp. NIES-2104]